MYFDSVVITRNDLVHGVLACSGMVITWKCKVCTVITQNVVGILTMSCFHWVFQGLEIPILTP